VTTASPSSLWFARHEARLAWREWRGLMTGGRRSRLGLVLVALLAFAALMHLPAWALVVSFAKVGTVTDKPTLIIVSAGIALYGSLILSQALESVTRAFYARADLDLILSAPVSARRVFFVRIAAIALAMMALATVMAAPVVDMLAIIRGSHWLLAYGVIASTGAVTTALAVALTVALFRTIGPKRTRLVAQVLAAIVGAAFVIGLQAAAILYYGTLAQPSLLVSDAVVAAAPVVASPLWWPARAVMGDPMALAAVIVLSLALLLAVAVMFSARFGDHALAASASAPAGARRRPKRAFRSGSPRVVLRRKEWALLRRDSWLVSQTLTQLLYLLPPALLLSRSFGDSASTLVVIIFAMVAVGGQLGGGLAWLAISGEDAPDLVATAPVTQRVVLSAKIEAVMLAVAVIFLPFIAALLVLKPAYAAVTAGGVAVAALVSIRIQLWFRAQAKRSHFRRRRTSSRLATFAEGFSSFAWAGTASLVATQTWPAAIAAAFFALLILGGARLVAPKRQAA
jgi:ABC-2 type transport system permease protein